MHRFIAIILATWLWANPVHADEIKDFCQSYVGKNYFLKIDVVKIYQGISNTDATNIYPSGEVLHRKASSVSHDAEMFIAEIGRQAIADNQDWKLSLLRRGTELLVHKVETKKTEVQIEFTQQSGREKKDWLELPRNTVRLKFDKG